MAQTISQTLLCALLFNHIQGKKSYVTVEFKPQNFNTSPGNFFSFLVSKAQSYTSQVTTSTFACALLSAHIKGKVKRKVAAYCSSLKISVVSHQQLASLKASVLPRFDLQIHSPLNTHSRAKMLRRSSAGTVQPAKFQYVSRQQLLLDVQYTLCDHFQFNVAVASTTDPDKERGTWCNTAEAPKFHHLTSNNFYSLHVLNVKFYIAWVIISTLISPLVSIPRENKKVKRYSTVHLVWLPSATILFH